MKNDIEIAALNEIKRILFSIDTRWTEHDVEYWGAHLSYIVSERTLVCKAEGVKRINGFFWTMIYFQEGVPKLRWAYRVWIEEVRVWKDFDEMDRWDADNTLNTAETDIEYFDLCDPQMFDKIETRVRDLLLKLDRTYKEYRTAAEACVP